MNYQQYKEHAQNRRPVNSLTEKQEKMIESICEILEIPNPHCETKFDASKFIEEHIYILHDISGKEIEQTQWKLQKNLIIYLTFYLIADIIVYNEIIRRV